jgi:hypothetical protein
VIIVALVVLCLLFRHAHKVSHVNDNAQAELEVLRNHPVPRHRPHVLIDRETTPSLKIATDRILVKFGLGAVPNGNFGDEEVSDSLVPIARERIYRWALNHDKESARTDASYRCLKTSLKDISSPIATVLTASITIEPARSNDRRPSVVEGFYQDAQTIKALRDFLATNPDPALADRAEALIRNLKDGTDL